MFQFRLAENHLTKTKKAHPKFNSVPLKNDGWKTSLSYWVSVTFQGRLLFNFRGGGIRYIGISLPIGSMYGSGVFTYIYTKNQQFM